MGSSTTHRTGQRTATMPVTTMEEVPILSDAERGNMLASLKEAEARIAAGQSTQFDPQTFKDRLANVYRTAKNAKTV